MGILQFAENIKLLSQKGEQLITDKSFSAIEFIWLLISIWILYKGGLSVVGILAISILISYHLLEWLVGLRAYHLSHLNNSDEIIIPLWYFKINMAISILFSVVAFYAFKGV